MNELWTHQHDRGVVWRLKQRAASLISQHIQLSMDAGLKTAAINLCVEFDLTQNSDQESSASLNMEDIFNYIKSEKIIEKCKVEAFLCVRAKAGSNLDQWQSLVMAAALEHLRIFQNRERSHRALSAFRYIVNDASPEENPKVNAEIEMHLPSPWLPLDQIILEISRLLDNKSFSKAAKSRVLPIRRILDDIYKNEQKNQRDRIHSGSRKTNKKNVDREDSDAATGPIEGGKILRSVPALVDESEAGYDEISDIVLNDLDASPEEIELAIDDSNVYGVVSVQPDRSESETLKKSAALSNAYAVNVIAHIERREKRLVTLHGILTEREIDILKHGILKYAKSHYTEALILHLMLTTGRRLEQLIAAKKGSIYGDVTYSGNAYGIKDGRIYWQYRPKLPKHEVSEKFKRFIIQKKSPAFFVLPYFPVSDSLEENTLPTCKEEISKRVHDVLKEINKQHSTRITINRIADYLTFFLHQHGVDDVIIAIITGNPRIQPAGVYYQQYDNEVVIDKYEMFTKKIFGDSSGFLKEKSAFNEYRLGGSQLQVTENVISSLFSHLLLEVKNARNRGAIAFHNALSMYVVHVLNLATGHRPVNDPGDDLNSIDLISGKIFISDKQQGDRSTARTLVLPEIAVRILDSYIEYLRSSKNILASFNSTLSVFVEKVLKGRRQLLFLLDDANPYKGDVIPITPDVLRSRMACVFDFPLNWNRHYMRTFLASSGVCGNVIDSWMGHAKPGQEGYTKFSGLSMKQMKEVAEIINKKMKELNVKLISELVK